MHPPRLHFACHCLCPPPVHSRPSTIDHRPSTLFCYLLAPSTNRPSTHCKGKRYLPASLPTSSTKILGPPYNRIKPRNQALVEVQAPRYLHLLFHITSSTVGCCIQASAFCKPAAPHRTATQLGPPLNLQPKPRTRHFSTLYLPNYLPIAATHPTPIYHHHHYHQPPFCLSRPDPNLIWPLLGFNLSRFVLHHLATLAPLPGCFFSYFGLHPRPCEAQ